MYITSWGRIQVPTQKFSVCCSVTNRPWSLLTYYYLQTKPTIYPMNMWKVEGCTKFRHLSKLRVPVHSVHFLESQGLCVCVCVCVRERERERERDVEERGGENYSFILLQCTCTWQQSPHSPRIAFYALKAMCTCSLVTTPYPCYWLDQMLCGCLKHLLLVR